jgi:hypothetical protein
MGHSPATAYNRRVAIAVSISGRPTLTKGFHMSESRAFSLRRRIWSGAALVSALAAMGATLPGAAFAQEVQSDPWLDLRPGTVVDMELLNPTMKCTGKVTARQVDTIIVSRIDSCRSGDLSKADVQSFRLQFNEGSRSDHAGKGLLIGLVSGAILGKLAGPKCVLDGPCDAGFVTLGLIGGGALGSIVGLVVGLGRDAGEQWRPIPVPSVIRVSDRTVP